jgi:hypothetical protein
MKYILKYRKIGLLFFLMMVSFESGAQYFMTGQEPASTNWMQINTENFQLIFPESFSGKAQNVANILEYTYTTTSNSLNHEPRKASVVIHNKSVTSNGFVAPAPHRIELYSMPPQDNTTMDWLEHLCIHEMRHFVQIDKLNQGITKVLTYIFGEQANAVVAGLLPMWYLEGDAVIAETALTNNGRGRIPGFTKQIRSRLADSLPLYSFDKMLLGSYRNQTPDHYELGYHMTSFARKRYGADLWQNMENYVARNPYQVFSFNIGLDRLSGLYSGGIYDSALTFYDRFYASSCNETIDSKAQTISPSGHKDFISYRYPHYTENGKVIALKKDFSRLPRFISIDHGKEKILHIPGKMSFERYSYAKGQIVWSEEIPDTRWRNRSFSVIKMYDINNKKERTLTEKTRLFAPNISRDGERIAAIQVTRENEYSLVVLDTTHGWIQKQFSHPEGIFLQQPVWSTNGKHIFVLGTTENGKGIYQINYLTGKWKEMLEPSFREIQHMSCGREYLYFKAAVDHKEEICALNLERKQLYKVTDSRINASDVDFSPSGNSIVYADYESKGYNLVEKKIDEKRFEPLSKQYDSGNKMTEALRKGEKELFRSGNIPAKDYDTQNYNRLKNLFHFHSWAPLYLDYNINQKDISSISPGVTLFSQNLLSTALTTLGYSYQSGIHKLHTQFIYKGWYPVFEVSSHFGGKPDVIRPSSVDWVPKLSNDNLNIDASISLPLDFTQGKYISGFTPSVTYDYDRDLYHSIRKDYYLRGLKTINYNLWFYYYQRMAYRDLMPRWGFTFDLNIRSSPFSENLLGNMTSLAGRIYLPGLFEDHGIKLKLGYQEQNPEVYFYSSYLQFPRGFQTTRSEKLFIFQSDYAIPLFYPDWNIPSVLYFKRFKANLFHDYALNEYQMVVNNQRKIKKDVLYSLGTELTTDFHFARIMFPFSAGVRYSYLPQIPDHHFEVIFNVDFYRIYSKLF